MQLSASRYLVGLLLALTTVGCLQRNTSSTKAIIGGDDRQVVTDQTINAAVGTLHSGDGSALCTAFASSADEVVTAAHCLVAGTSDGQYQFWTKKHGYRKLERLSQSGVKSDVAVFKSSQLTPDFLPLASVQPNGSSARLIGFDFKTLSLVETTKGAIDVTSLKAGVYRHTFDTLPGQSGSPIVQDGKVVAVHIGSLKDGKVNLAVATREMEKADVLGGYPDFAPENPAASIIRRIGVKKIRDKVIEVILDDLTSDAYESAKTMVVNYIEKVWDRIKREAEAREFRTRALDRDNPGNLSPGGWTGPDFNRGADSRGTAIALTADGDADIDHKTELKIFLGGALGIIYERVLNRDFTADELRAMAQHIRNGGSYGFLKATVLKKLPINERHGNNGTVSCDTFCAERRFTDAPGSCVSAKISTTGRGVHCSEVPGFVDGGELTCSCLGDGFSKPGNNGTVSCRDFCWGEQWGAVGNCLAAYKGDSISCDTASGSPQDCVCGGFTQ
ncbi:MAG: trypsin-like serine protease [Deltaproteobacteria bacterium]|nr:trypsin-like serine protease [Deltaproteobacteria bacterium]